MKRFCFEVPDDVQEGRLYSYLTRMMPEVPSYALREAFRNRDVKVNGRRVSTDEPITPGSSLMIFLPDSAVQEISIPVLFEDDRVMIAVKPAGISCETDRKGGLTLTQLLHKQLQKQNPQADEPLLCHRLDNPTSGLMILAKTHSAQEGIQQAFAERQIHKEYTCIVKGKPEPEHAIHTVYLLKNSQESIVRVFPRPVPGGRTAVTEYTVVEGGKLSKLKIRLHTGRTHQIRAHMAFLSHPVLGDDLYGDRELNKRMHVRRLFLCATGLSFSITGSFSYLNDKHFSIQPDFDEVFYEK